jgi:hypothetical protein
MAIETNYTFVADGLVLTDPDKVDTNSTLVSESTFLADNLHISGLKPIRKDGTLKIEMRLTIPTQLVDPNSAGDFLLLYPNWDARMIFPNGYKIGTGIQATTVSSGSAKLFRAAWEYGTEALRDAAWDEAFVNYNGQAGTIAPSVEFIYATDGNLASDSRAFTGSRNYQLRYEGQRGRLL